MHTWEVYTTDAADTDEESGEATAVGRADPIVFSSLFDPNQIPGR